MATYEELYGLRQDSPMRHKVIAAIAIAADTVRTESGATGNHANRLVWAADAYASPESMADQVWWSVLAANKDASVSAITSGTDAALQTNVDAVVDVLAGVA